MEVHHHPDLHHKGKKWKEYFLEFLMIFLAVTMGFFAENIREHFSDNERVAQLSRQLIQDLKKDTASLAMALPEFKTPLSIATHCSVNTYGRYLLC
jgi:hypothetical protein